MDVRHPALLGEQRAEVAHGLRALHLAEGPAHLRDLHVLGVVRRHYEEESRVGPAFMELARGVQIAGTERGGGDAADGGFPRRPDLLQPRGDVGSRRQKRQNRRVITRPRRPAQHVR